MNETRVGDQLADLVGKKIWNQISIDGDEG